MPDGWLDGAKPPLVRPEDAVLYELHLRDFSASDATVPAEHRGTYLAFTHEGSFGMRHLRALQAAGLTHIHLLPTFDIATIDEDAANRIEPTITEMAGTGASPRQQEALHPVRDRDAFNWGYDPYHYTVPEGSYATAPDGGARIVEFRQMVQALNDSGLRVVLDVVYNHTNASGQSERSVLDRIVPGYYHRLDGNGFVATSTCCANTATEHAMMRKLMVDSVLIWATAYRVDGFRFDLMGHHMLADMRTVRAALNGLTPADDGIDGRAIVLYGEGWNFGEVADGTRGVNATQPNVAGSGIGSFNDRLRDGVRGGGPFDNGDTIAESQGFASGLGTLPSRLSGTVAPAVRAARNADLVRVGLAGNLRDYVFEGYDGSATSGAQVDYNGAPAGYTLDPQENVVYVSAHDNRTLWDILQLKLPDDMETIDRIRLQAVAHSTVALAQGIPFFHAGSDLLRSKSLDRNSYNSGDHFNRLDFSLQSNNFAVGLPPAEDNRQNWNLYRPVLENPLAQPTPSDIAYSGALFQELLRIRSSSPLFRLANAAEVQARLAFHNTGPEQTPGLIVMSLSDQVPGRADLDAQHELIVVVFNASPERQTFAVEGRIALTTHEPMPGFIPSLRQLLRQLLGAAVTAVLSAGLLSGLGCSPPPDKGSSDAQTVAMTRAERLARTIREYDAQGIHRTGTEVDQQSARWLAELIREAGFEPALEPLEFERLDTVEAYLEVSLEDGGDRIRYDGIPMFDCASYTDASGITAHLAPPGRLDDEALAGTIEVVRLPPRAQYLESFQQVRTSSERAGVVVITGGGEFDLPESFSVDPLPEGYALINADRFADPYGLPVLQLPSQTGNALVRARQRGAEARLVIHTERTETTVYNVTTTVKGTDEGASPIVIMTPRSGWWYNASERGGGLAIFIELLHALRESPPQRTLHFVASTGHELGHIGLDHYLETRRAQIRGARLWLHLGANFATAVGGGVRIQASSQELLDDVLSRMEEHGLAPDTITPIDQRPYGEARNIYDGGGHFLSLLGQNGLFHSPEDRWPQAVDSQLLESLTDIVIDQMLELAQTETTGS